MFLFPAGALSERVREVLDGLLEAGVRRLLVGQHARAGAALGAHFIGRLGVSAHKADVGLDHGQAQSRGKQPPLWLPQGAVLSYPQIGSQAAETTARRG